MTTAVNLRGSMIGRGLLAGAAAIAAISIGYRLTRDDGKDLAPAAAPAPGSAVADDSIPALQARVGANPKDVESWQRLGWVYFERGRHADAARAYKRAVALAPGNAALWSAYGEALVMADERDPMPNQAAMAFDKALAIDAKEPRARYFAAVRQDLAGGHEAAIKSWLALLADTPPGAPWELDLRRTIEQVGKINRIDVADRLAAIKPTAHPAIDAPVATAAIPGPTREQMQAAASLPKGAQDQMIAGMLQSLESKLRANPANIEGWIMLMRSRMTLGEGAKASDALARAIAANSAQAARLKDEARVLGVPGA
ncbi:tetratricopeptide repeat protein [Sphingobium sp. AN641]|uniref:tetratricopeptide repeat protein n=1 Tax=Sphingobium sp. AN641 TaxID=3133443 RepID=UPI0030C19906